MKIFTIFACQIIIFQVLAQDFNPPQCTDDEVLFKGKCKDAKNCKTQIGYFKQTMAKGKKHIAQRPSISVQLIDENLQFSLAFQNAKDFQTSVETGLNTTCIQVSLKRYGPAFTNQVNDTTQLVSTLNGTTRIWSFKVENSKYDDIFLKDETNDNIRYTGFYAIVVQLLLPNNNGVKPLAFFGFEFSVTLSTDLKTLYSSKIIPKVQAEETCADEDGSYCVFLAKSEISLYSDPICSLPLVDTQLVVGEYYYIKKKITEEGFKSWKPMDAELTIVGKGVTKSVKTKRLDKGSQGEQCYKVQINFLANNITIASEATMIDTTTPSRILVEDLVDDSYVVGSSTIQTCIKRSIEADCPSQEEVIQYNSENCNQFQCDYSQRIMIIELIMIMISMMI